MAKKKAVKSYTASFFYSSVVQVIGELSGFEAEKGVPNQDVIDRVLKIHDLDKEVMGFSKTRTDKKSEVALRISWAFRNQRAEYLGKKNPRKAALCVPGDKKGSWALTAEGVAMARELSPQPEEKPQKKTKKKKGGGGNGGNGGGSKKLPVVAPDTVEETSTDLVGFETPVAAAPPLEGSLSIQLQCPDHLDGDALRAHLFGEMFRQGQAQIEALIRQRSVTPDVGMVPVQEEQGRNLTAEYLGENWNNFYPKVCEYVAKRLPKSNKFGLVEDHVMNYMVDVMARDGLRSRLEDKGGITANVLGYYVYNAAVTEMRAWGTEPLHRCLHGARTETERTKGWKNPASVIHPDPKKVVTPSGDPEEARVAPVSGSSGKGAFMTVQDWYGEDLRETIDHIRTAEEYMVRCEEVLREHANVRGRGKDRGDSWVHLLHLLMEGYGPSEIADEMGINRSTVSNRVQKVRGMLQDAMSRGRFEEVRGTMH